MDQVVLGTLQGMYFCCLYSLWLRHTLTSLILRFNRNIQNT